MSSAPLLSKRRRRVAAIGSAGSVVVLALLLALTLARWQAGRRWVGHTRDVMRAADAVLVQLLDAELSHRVDRSATAVDDRLTALAAEIRDNPVQQTRVDSLRRAVAVWHATVDDDQAHAAARSVVRAQLAAFQAEEWRLLGERERREMAQARQAVATLVIGSLIAVCCILVLKVGLARAADAHQAAAEALADRNALLEEQAVELELQAAQLQDQAVELEAHLATLEFQAGELEVRAEIADNARRTAEEANRAKASFLTTMSHELRTPLNAIIGYVELLLLDIRGPLAPLQRRDLERTKGAAQVLLSLITDVLNFARLDAGRVDLTLSTVPLAVAIADAVALVAPIAAAKGITLDVHPIPPGLAAHADADKLRQILLNLFSNAVKFTDGQTRSAPIVRIAAASDAAYGDLPPQVRLVVSDTGRGIPSERLAEIFDPFVQVDRHLTRDSQQGVGLGLAIARELARRMSGDITVSSTPDVGSTFTILLPASVPRHAVAPARPVHAMR